MTNHTICPFFVFSTMGGKPFKVGRFAHTLRVRLMREHLGVDVDAMYEDDLMAFEPAKPIHEQDEWDPDAEQQYGKEDDEVTHLRRGTRHNGLASLAHDTAQGLGQLVHGADDIEGKQTAHLLRKVGIKTASADATTGDQSLNEERTTFTRSGEKEHGFTSSIVPTLEEKTIAEGRPPFHRANGGLNIYVDSPGENAISEQTEPEEARADGELYGSPANADPRDKEPPHPPSAKTDADEEEEKAPGARATLRKHLAAKFAGSTKASSKTWSLPTVTPEVDPYGFEDPICDEFWKNVWVACATHNVSTSIVSTIYPFIQVVCLYSTDRNLPQGVPCYSG